MLIKDERGRSGEDVAAAFVEGLGMRVLERNWRCARGELDLIALEGAVLVFIEVKTRSTTAYGHPFEAISPAKLARLWVLARMWVAEHPQGVRRELRVDAVSVLLNGGEAPLVEHLRGIA